jgi:DNA-binding transcriptional MerR regulator
MINEKIRGLEDKTFFSKAAGSFSGVPQRTVQAWTEKGLVQSSDTTGTGDRRLYSPMQCVEIGIVRALTSERLSLRIAGHIMDRLRGSLERPFSHDRAHLIVHVDPDKDKRPDGGFITYAPTFQLVFWNEGAPMPRDEKDQILHDIFERPCDKVLVLNLTRIAERVLAQMV